MRIILSQSTVQLKFTSLPSKKIYDKEKKKNKTFKWADMTVQLLIVMSKRMGEIVWTPTQQMMAIEPRLAAREVARTVYKLPNLP